MNNIPLKINQEWRISNSKSSYIITSIEQNKNIANVDRYYDSKFSYPTYDRLARQSDQNIYWSSSAWIYMDELIPCNICNKFCGQQC